MSNKTEKNKRINIENVTGILLFIIALLWFYYPAEYVLIANSDLTLFLKTPAYLLSFLDRPGGLIEYLGSFLSQFFRFRLTGALVLSTVIAGGYFSLGRLIERFSGQKSSPPALVIATVLLMGMHNFYPHQFSHSLGFILAIFMAAFMPRGDGKRRLFLAFAVPAIYLLSGGFVWFFCALILVGNILRKGKTDLMSLILTSLYPASLIVVGSLILFLDPLKELFLTQLPFGPQYGESLWPYLFIVCLLAMILLSEYTFARQKLNHAWRRGVEIVLGVAGLVLILHFSYNRKNAEFFAIEKMAIQENWDELLRYTSEHPSSNLFGSYYTNLALVNKHMLCEALFQNPQGFGRRGLFFEWEEKSEILRRGSDFFWTIAFVNEAHHWAFESSIIDGFTQRNLRRLIQCELVRGNFEVAAKYIAYLDKALFHKKMASHYSAFLYQKEAIAKDAELGPRMNASMEHDFFAEGADQETNLRSVLANNPSNLPSLNYLMALYLLEKEVDKIAALLPSYLEAHEGHLPTLLEECLLVYQISHRDEANSDMRVSQATLQRFTEYTSVLRQYRNPEEAARMLYPNFKHSFWFHLNFNPSK